MDTSIYISPGAMLLYALATAWYMAVWIWARYVPKREPLTDNETLALVGLAVMPLAFLPLLLSGVVLCVESLVGYIQWRRRVARITTRLDEMDREDQEDARARSKARSSETH